VFRSLDGLVSLTWCRNDMLAPLVGRGIGRLSWRLALLRLRRLFCICGLPPRSRHHPRSRLPLELRCLFRRWLFLGGRRLLGGRLLAVRLRLRRFFGSLPAWIQRLFAAISCGLFAMLARRLLLFALGLSFIGLRCRLVQWLLWRGLFLLLLPVVARLLGRSLLLHRLCGARLLGCWLFRGWFPFLARLAGGRLLLCRLLGSRLLGHRLFRGWFPLPSRLLDGRLLLCGLYRSRLPGCRLLHGWFPLPSRLLHRSLLLCGLLGSGIRTGARLLGWGFLLLGLRCWRRFGLLDRSFGSRRLLSTGLFVVLLQQFFISRRILRNLRRHVLSDLG
jgi:hypothetical protein